MKNPCRVQKRDINRKNVPFLSLCGLFLFSCLASGAEVAGVASFTDLYSLKPQELAQARPFSIEAQVVCFDREWHQMYLDGGTDLIYIDPAWLQQDARSGDWVRLQGLTCVTGNGLPLTNLQMQVLRREALPKARPIVLSAKEIPTGSWVEFSAEVHAAETSREKLGLLLSAGGTKCQAFVMSAKPSKSLARSYLGAKVLVRGIISRHPENAPNEWLLIVPDFTHITVLSAPAVPTEKLAVTSVETLLNRPMGLWTNSPVRVNGTVMASVPGKSLVFKDPTGTLVARVAQVDPAEPGTRVNVWGYIQPTPDGLCLADACFDRMYDTPLSTTSVPDLSSTNSSVIPVATNLVQLRSMTPRKLKAGIPIRVTGTVLYSDPSWRTAFLYDGSVSSFVELLQPDIVPGQFVEVEGTARSGDFAPIVRSARFRVLGAINLPPPVPAELDDLADGHLDAQWIEMRGRIRKALVDNGHLRLWFLARGGSFRATVPNISDPKIATNLLYSTVAARGICISDLNGRAQVTAITLSIPDLNQLRVIEPAPADPFAVRETPISKVATFGAVASHGLLKIRGVVTLSLSGQTVFVQDDSTGIRVEMDAEQAPVLKPGDLVEAAGYVAMGDFSPKLVAPMVHRLRSARVPAALAATAEHLLAGTNDALFVQLEATLLQNVPRSGLPTLVLQEGAIIFTAQLAHGVPSSFWNLKPGSRLRLSGVCTLQAAEDRTPQSLRLFLPDPSAVEVLSGPPLASPRQILFGIGMAALVALASMAWIASLRRQVNVRTAELQTSQANLRQQFERATQFSELGRRLNAAHTPKEAAEIILDIADDLIGWDACICDRYSAQTARVFHVFSMDVIDGKRTECQPAVSQLAPSALARKAIELGPQLVLRSPSDAGFEESLPFGDGSRRSASILYVPIRDGSEVIGTLSVQSYSFNAYDAEDLRTFEALAEHCSGAFARILTQQKIVDLSRLAGMAEVATSVLHNVGNVLNSINVSVALLSRHNKDSHAARLERVVAMLHEHERDLGEFITRDPKGAKIPAYLQELGLALRLVETRSRSELQSLAENLNHVKQIVMTQQSFTRLGGMAEKVNAVELVENVLQLADAALARHRIVVCRKYPASPPSLIVDKHKVLQILLNLVTNAKHACQESSRNDRKLTIIVGNADKGVRISVQDNGVGIPKENLSLIFSHGFTTRKNGHGFGLHSGALAARELGGRLHVQSDGPNAGATFMLDLPAQASN